MDSYVEEPEIKDPDSGAIYLWLIDNNPTIKDKSWFDIISNVINGRQPRVYVIQYTRQMHEEIAELEKQRQGQPMPITLLNESKSKEKMESHNGESSDKADFIPYIFPDITTIVK